MAVPRQKKEEILQSLVEKFGKSKSVVFAANNGLSVESLSTLRKELRKNNIEFQVAKKTLFLKLFADQGVTGLSKELLDGAVGAAFSYEDQVLPAKLMAKFAKKNEKLLLVGGVLDGKVLGTAEIQALATLPSKSELLAKLMGSMLAPLSGFVGMGNAVIGGFVRVADQIRKQKEAA